MYFLIFGFAFNGSDIWLVFPIPGVSKLVPPILKWRCFDTVEYCWNMYQIFILDQNVI